MSLPVHTWHTHTHNSSTWLCVDVCCSLIFRPFVLQKVRGYVLSCCYDIIHLLANSNHCGCRWCDLIGCGFCQSRWNASEGAVRQQSIIGSILCLFCSVRTRWNVHVYVFVSHGHLDVIELWPDYLFWTPRLQKLKIRKNASWKNVKRMLLRVCACCRTLKHDEKWFVYVCLNEGF